jgi:hypothetical protein
LGLVQFFIYYYHIVMRFHHMCCDHIEFLVLTIDFLRQVQNDFIHCLRPFLNVI